MSNDPADRIMSRCAALREISESDERYTRRYLTVEHRRAADLIGDWMIAAGLSTRMDAAGNMVGRLEGAKPELPALILASHFDTVTDAGTYDGQLGVVTAIEVAAALSARSASLPFAIEVYAFADEEGGRFPTGYLASGQLVEQRVGADLMIADHDGTTLDEAMRAFGINPDELSAALRDPQDFVGYMEIHIEQGPVLEAEDLAVGTVTSIAGAMRLAVTVTGMGGHAGTVPMVLRRDALNAAAEVALGLETIAKRYKDMVGTVGMVTITNPAINVIPGDVAFTIDLRAPIDADRLKARAELTDLIDEIAARRHVSFQIETTYESNSTKLDTRLMTAIDAASVEVQGVARRLPSGAGHDAAMMAKLCPSAMIFVRCKDGVSHHPDESITQDDAGAGYRVMLGAVEGLARESNSP